jgi:hypothetical protein
MISAATIPGLEHGAHAARLGCASAASPIRCAGAVLRIVS